LCCVCVYTACKIDYRHQNLESLINIYLEHNKAILTKGSARRLKPEGDLKTQLMIDFCTLEIGLLNSINYEMEFDVPLKYKDHFKHNYLDVLLKNIEREQPT